MKIQSRRGRECGTEEAGGIMGGPGRPACPEATARGKACLRGGRPLWPRRWAGDGGLRKRELAPALQGVLPRRLRRRERRFDGLPVPVYGQWDWHDTEDEGGAAEFTPLRWGLRREGHRWYKNTAGCRRDACGTTRGWGFMGRPAGGHSPGLPMLRRRSREGRPACPGQGCGVGPYLQ